MCKLNKKNDGRRIDPCMRGFIKRIKDYLYCYGDEEIVACCCGHKKYSMTIVVNNRVGKSYFYDLVSGVEIPRKKRFYKKDKQGYYYIPEVVNGK